MPLLLHKNLMIGFALAKMKKKNLMIHDGYNLPDDLTRDAIHPNAKAYSIMAEVLKKYLK